MVIYYVNVGHFASFVEANRFRKEKLPPGAGYILACGGYYTVRVLSTPKKSNAEKWIGKGGMDIWISERDTSAGRNDDGR